MKGLLFCEFIEFAEHQLGEDQAQEIIDAAELKSEGAYSRVGFYDYQELIQLLTATAEYTQLKTEDLLQGFANHLFGVFKRDYGVFFEKANNAADMLKTIDDHIHVEVKKLYPDAELPKFSYIETNNELHLHYESPRPLAGVAHALVNACLLYYGEEQTLIRYEISEDQKSAFFVIQVKAE
jgi:hypothetical protein